jgi:hypothetical protein
LLVKDKIIADEKKKNIKNSVYSPTDCIPIGCLIKKPFEKWIKKIENIVNQWFQKKG